MTLYTPYVRIECSSCHAADQTETIHRDTTAGSELVLRCTQCGHEKVISTITVSISNKEQIYKLDRKDIEYF